MTASSGVILPRVTMPSSEARVLLIRKSCGRPILSRSLFFDEDVSRTSRIVTASANGLSGIDCQCGNFGGVDRLAHDLADHPADRGQLGIIEGLGVSSGCGSEDFRRS